jgi:LysM repeat protein
MTRETRIGLLVGLAFIVMFGVVLGDLTRSTPREGQAGSFNNDRVVETYNNAPVVTPPPIARNEGYSPNRNEAGLTELSATGRRDYPDGESVAQAWTVRPDERLPGSGSVHAQPVRAPQPVDPGQIAGSARDVAIERPPQRREVQPAPAGRTHTVVSGESLIKIAKLYYGPDGGRHYKLIFQANSNILSDESSVRPGQKLVIPPLPDAPVAAPAERRERAPRVRGVREVGVEELERTLEGMVRGADGTVYVVQRGDTLYGIARKTMRGQNVASAIERIKQANGIEDARRLPVGMELKIPG